MTDPTLTVTLDRGGDPDNATYFASSVVGLPGGGSAVAWGVSGSAEIEFLSITGAVTATTTLLDSHFDGSDYFIAPLSNGDVVLTYDGIPEGKCLFQHHRSEWRHCRANRGDARRRHLSGGTIYRMAISRCSRVWARTAIPL